MATRLEIYSSVRENLYDSGVTFFSVEDINRSIQDGYNLIAAVCGTTDKSTHFPQIATPYYDLSVHIPDFYSIIGIYNKATNRWLSFLPVTGLDRLRSDWELWNGEPEYYHPVDFKRLCLVPFNSSPTNTLYIWYKAKAPILSDTSVPDIPTQNDDILEFYSTADLLEQAREFKKAQIYWEQYRASLPTVTDSIDNLAKYDRIFNMCPFDPLFRYAGDYMETWIDNETPSGTINGANTTFLLSQVPNPTNSLMLTKNGLMLYSGDGYTLNSLTLTMSVAPTGGDILRAWYRVD